MIRARTLVLGLFALALGWASSVQAQMEPTTRRGPDEGGGPYQRLIIRGVTVIDGTGGPPRGPMDGSGAAPALGRSPP